MGFVGRFELTVPDILQILSLANKTGKLRLSRLGNTGEIHFRDGKIIHAGSDSSRNTLGNILMREQHLSEDALMAALELQHLSTDSKRLGAILVEKGLITPEVLQEAIRYQIEEAISEFLTWEDGFFRFDMMDVSTGDGITVDTNEFLVKKGMAPELLLIEGARRLDERRKAEPVSAPSSPPPARAPIADATASPRRDDWRAPDHRRPRVPEPAPVAPPDTPALSPLDERWEPETRDPRLAEVMSVGSPPAPRPVQPREVEPSAWIVPEPDPDLPRVDPRPVADVDARPTAEPVSAPPAAETPRPRTAAGHDAETVPRIPPSPVPPQPVPQELSASALADAITFSSPISPWVLIMNFASEVVTRGVLFSVRKDGFTAFDQFGVPDGIETGNDRRGPITIPLNEPSPLSIIATRRATYRGKIGAGKWHDYFMDRLGGTKPREALLIPIVVAGKVVALFYGDDAGTGKPFGDVGRLEAQIRQTFSAVETSLLEKEKKGTSRR